MKELKKARQAYESIKIPEQLNYIVNKAVSNNPRKRNYDFRYFKYVTTTIASAFFAFVLLINTNVSFAESVSEIPIIGDIARVVTIKEYHKKDELKLINAKIPAIENTGNTDLEKRINYEIMLKMTEILDEAEKRAEDYRDAVLETGGTMEDYHAIDIEVNYKVGYSSNQTVSFIITKTETLASAYTEEYFYNIDIETGKSLNLRDLLGEDYKQIVDETINKEIEERSKNPDNIYFSKSQGGFSGIEDEYQNFYINSNGKVVIVFKKYEIAPGYMGIQEFEIDRPIFKKI